MFRFKSKTCDNCHDLMQNATSFHVVIIFVKTRDCRIHYWSTIKYEAISIMKNSDLKQKKVGNSKIVKKFYVYIKIEKKFCGVCRSWY